MNKTELASSVATRTSITKATADSAVAAVFATIAATPLPGRASPSPPPQRRRSRPARRSATQSTRSRTDGKPESTPACIT